MEPDRRTESLALLSRLAELDGMPIHDLYNRYLADGLEVPFEQL